MSMLARLLVIVGLVSAGLLLFIVTTMPPSTAGAFGILAVFVLSYLVLLSILTYVLWLFSRGVGKLGSELRLAREPRKLSFKKSYYYSSVIAIGPVIVVSLQSVGGIGLYELLLVGIFIVLGCLYVARRSV